MRDSSARRLGDLHDLLLRDAQIPAQRVRVDGDADPREQFERPAFIGAMRQPTEATLFSTKKDVGGGAERGNQAQFLIHDRHPGTPGIGGSPQVAYLTADPNATGIGPVRRRAP